MNTDIIGLPEFATKVLLKSAQLIGSSLNPQRVMHKILRLLAEDLKMQRGRILTLDDKNVLTIRYAYGLSQEDMKKGRYAIGEGVTGRIVETGEVAWIQNIQDEPAYLSRLSDITFDPNGELAYLAVPIKVNADVIGVLAVNPSTYYAERFYTNLCVLEILAAMIGQLLALHEKVQRRTQALQEENRRLKHKQTAARPSYGLIGKSDAFKQAVSTVDKAAKSQASVLLTGESGVGKERFAKMIHMASNRRDKPFIGLNCAAIPDNLLESELFGHEKGSFTHALNRRIGKFELANQGTLFLDEIGDMPVDLQVKILRVLQEHSFTRVGGQEDIHVDVRIIAATHQDLQHSIAQGSFRLDLFYRLNVINIQLPSLRERREDIRELAAHFLMRENDRNETEKYFSEEALQLLEQHPWPGNIRQLENIVMRATVLSEQSILDKQFIQNLLNQENSVTDKVTLNRFQAGSNRQYRYVKHNERHQIERALIEAEGNKTLAAKTLGLTTRQLYYRMEKLEIGLNDS